MQSRSVNSAVCTLFEGHYHFGVGALANSLSRNGFRGVLWAGYRGELPPWAEPMSEGPGYREFAIKGGCTIRFVPLDTEIFFANYKPHFMLELLERHCPEAEQLFYFDPDIVVKCRWSFFEEWCSYGTAVCVDNCYPNISATHPLRQAWKAFAREAGYSSQRDLAEYYNSGFVGVARSEAAVLECWRDLINRVGETEVNIRSFKDREDYGVEKDDRSHPFYVADQDTFNIALMATAGPISAIGTEGMDFTPAGYTMSHAVDSPKPWKKRMALMALTGGHTPALPDRMYMDYALEPIRLYSGLGWRLKQLDYVAGKVLGMILGR